MKNEIEVQGDQLRITRTFDAPRELVFAAWTEPERLRVWGGCAGSTIRSVTLDLRVGGEYRTVMDIDGVGEMTALGTYTEVDPPRRIAYRLRWEPAHAPGETTITVDFLERGGQTEVRLVQDGLGSDEMREAARGGWIASFERFAERLAAGGIGARP